MAKQAIVIGSGIAGLLSAKLLSEFFDRVIVFERDVLTDKVAARKYIPRGLFLALIRVRKRDIRA